MANKHKRELAQKKRALDHLRRGQLVEAKTLLYETSQRGSNDPEIWYHLAMINARLGVLDGVEPYLRQALSLAPGFNEAALRLGEVLAYLGRLPDAIEILRKLAANNPTLIDAWMKLGNVLEASGNHADAIHCYQQVTTHHSRHDPAHTCLGNAYYFIGEYADAIHAYEKAIQINPDNLRAQLGKHLSLPHIYQSKQHMLDARAAFTQGIDKLLAMSERLKQCPSLIDDLQWSYNFYLAYQGMDDKPLQESFGKFFTSMVGHALPQFMQALPASSTAGRRIRVGYAAHFFHSHTVSFYFNNWITHANKDMFETYVYHINPIMDSTSQQLASSCSHYRPIAGAIATMAQLIRNDTLDILVFPEVGMFSKVQWLAAMRLAPIQCAAWGHPVTTGLANIDYMLSAEATEPENAQSHYSEKLAYISGIGAYLVPAPLDRRGTREEFNLPPARHLYLCSQSLFKIHLDMDTIMVALAKRDPEALILLFDDYKPAVNTAYKQRIHAAFNEQGLSPEHYLQFLPRMKPADFLRLNHLADVMIDTPHWSGGRTSLDALSVGLPIVTLPGQFSRGRQTFGMLKAIGLPELIATDNEDYVSKAIAIAGDKHRRSQLYQHILDRSPGTLFRVTESVRSIEEFITAVVAH